MMNAPMTSTTTGTTIGTTSRRAAKLAAPAFALAVTLFAGSAASEAPDLAGAWSGSGSVTFPSGATERARCRVTYSPSSKTGYSASASCATSSGRIDQTATLRRVGDNRFSGTFHNAEYNVTGSITVVVSGRSQAVSLSGDNGTSASLRLSR